MFDRGEVMLFVGGDNAVCEAHCGVCQDGRGMGASNVASRCG